MNHAEVKALFDKGLYYKAIAAKLGLKHWQVSKFIWNQQRKGLWPYRARRPWTKLGKLNAASTGVSGPV